MKHRSNIETLFMYWDFGIETSKHGLETKNIQNFIKRDDLEFDLILAEQFFQESWLMFAHKFKAPIVTISTYGNSDFFDRAMGILTPWSHVPHMILNYGDQMTFMQRSYNVFISATDMIFRHFYYMRGQDKIALEHFKSLEGPLPSVYELEKSISMILINSHQSIWPPKPTMPGLINIGGAHIKPVKPLPIKIDSFLNGAEHGAIYFSLGSYVQSSLMPKEKVKEILTAFSKIKQRVLWKWEDDNIPDLPKNVMVSKWMPQSDILAHKNIVLFITHGGLFGTMEGTHRGVPMLFIPLYGDQYRNALKAEAAGYAKTIKFSDITVKSLTSILNEMTSNTKYRDNIKRISELFRDNLVEPMDEAIHWIEYVIKHKGASHLKSSAVNMPWYEYLLLDVFLVFGGAFVILLLIIIKLFKKCIIKSKPKKLKKK